VCRYKVIETTKGSIIMDVSSTNNSDASSVQVDVLQKAIDVNQREALKIIENAIEESKKITAQKTGLGTHLNISG
jgi:hypothetical protein